MKHKEPTRNSLLYKQVLTLLIFVLGTINIAFTQNSRGYEYIYDNNGNRIQRMYIILKSTTGVDVQTNADDTASIVDRFADMKFIIYPNPTKGMIKIDIQDDKQQLQKEFLLYSLEGELLQTIEISDTSTAFIDLSYKPSGMYLLVCRMKNERKEWKIIKQ